MFDAGRQQKALTIAFYSQDGRPSRALDGFSANWLGATTTIADATATFETQQIIASSEPRDVLRRCALLFVGGHRWTPSFGNTPVDELDDGDDA
jgi:hypothetical protein